MNDNIPLPKQKRINRVRLGFIAAESQLTHGLQAFLEMGNVPKDTRKAVNEYMRDVLRGLNETRIEALGLIEPKPPDLEPEM